MDQKPTEPGAPAFDPSIVPPGLPAERPEPPQQSQVAPPATGNYLVRHWRGELPLGISYWVNTVLLNMLLAVAIVAVSAFVGRSNYGYVFALSLAWTAQCVVLPWQVVGVWRSAGRRRPDGTRSRWAGPARFVSVMGLIGFVVSLATEAVPSLWSTLEQARWLAEQGNWTVRVLRDGTEMEVAGGIGHGFAADLEARLAVNPRVTLVHVNLGRGGLVDEARKASRILRDRHLATYVSAKCVSACTEIYLGGKPRWLKVSARMGFHAPTAPGLRGFLEKRVMGEERRLLVEAGVSEAFATRAAATPHTSMWYPSPKELVAGGVVTRVTDGDSFAFTTGGLPPTIEAVRSLLASHRLYEALRKADPAAHERLVLAVHASLVGGRSMADSRAETFPIVDAAYRGQIANASDDALLAEVRARVLQMTDLQSASGPACMAIVMGREGDLAAEARRHLAPETQRIVIEAVADILESAAPGRARVDRAGRERLLARATRLARQEPGEALAESVLRGDGDLEPSEACRGVLLAYRAILRMPAAEGAALLRDLMAPAG